MARGNRKGSPGGTGGAPPQIISRLAWRALTANMLEPIAGNLRDQADAGPVPLESRGNRPKNMVEIVVPVVRTEVMMTIEIKAAMREYSMAVTPD
jgi:hypothetical protein